MGLDLQIFRFVLDSWSSGSDFSRVATLGRQHLSIDRKTYRREAKRYGLAVDDASVEKAYADYPFCDGFLRQLGAPAPASIDAAPFEGATHIADMNLPVPDELAGKFSTLIDGGTLEHIFDFRQSVINAARMISVGGHFVSINGANNFMGHGFYQFSPELFFRVFAPENGFEIEQMILTEMNDDGVWHDVTDPAVAGERVQLVNNARTYLMMRARKVAEVEMFTRTPQQSDYHNIAWEKPKPDQQLAFLKRPLHQRLVEQYAPRPARLVLRRLTQASRRHFSSKHLKSRGPFT